jgi:hypothetical protein
MKAVNFPVLNTADMSLGDVFSNAIPLQNSKLFSVHAGWTGGVGTLQVEMNNAPGVIPWSTLNASKINVSGPGDVVLVFADISYAWFRLHFVRAGGSGLLTAQLNLMDES